MGWLFAEEDVLRRFWLEKEALKGDRFLIAGQSFKHICQVSRMDEGARFEVLMGDGKAYFCELQAPAKKEAIALILEIRDLPPLRKPYIDLYLSVPKISKLEWIAEKAVELGVRRIVPVLSDYSFAKNSKIIEEKRKRLEKIVEGATRQSARGTLLEISSPVALDAALKEINRNDSLVGLFAYEGEAKLGLKQALKASRYRDAQEIAILVGSEGGFSHQEVQLCRENGLDPVSLGEQVLRVETACVTLISVLKYEMELFDWT